MDDPSNLPPPCLQSISSFSQSPEMPEMTEEPPEKSVKCIEEPAISLKKIVSFVLPISPNSKQINQLIGMSVLAVGLFITIPLLFHQISSSIQQSHQLDQFTQCEQKERSDEFTKINSKISQSDDRSTKIGADLRGEIDFKVAEMSRTISAKMSQNEAYLMGKIAKLEADLVDGRERNREVERKIAEMKRKNDDLEAQLRTQNTEVREGKAKIGELEGKIDALQSKNSGLETQINRTMTFLDLYWDGWSYLAETASWYKAFDQEMSFDAAEAYCASRKGHLVTIHSQEENDFVWEFAKTVDSDAGFWIGLKRNPNKGNAFEWTDGSSVDFTNWKVGEPDSRTHAELMSNDGKWRVWSPILHWRFICKRSSQF